MWLKKIKIIIKNFSYLKKYLLSEVNKLYAEECLGKELSKKKYLIEEGYQVNLTLHEKYGKLIKFEENAG